MPATQTPLRLTFTKWLLVVAALNIIFWIGFIVSAGFRTWLYDLLRPQTVLPVHPPEVSLVHILALLVWIWAAASCIWELSRWKRRIASNG